MKKSFIQTSVNFNYSQNETGADCLKITSAGNFARGLVAFSLPSKRNREQAYKELDECGLSVQQAEKAIAIDVAAREFSVFKVCRSLLKALLRAEQGRRASTSKDCVQRSKYTFTKQEIEKVFSCRYVGICDKYGNLYSNQVIDFRSLGKASLRSLLMPSDKKPLGEKVFVLGIDVDSPELQSDINDWVNSIIAYNNFVVTLGSIEFEQV